MTGALAGLLIDFQFYAAAASASMGSKGNANFFANFYILLNFSSLLLQLFATPKIQDKIGLRGGLMVLPFALIGGATFATAAATAFSRSVLRVTEGGLRSSVHARFGSRPLFPSTRPTALRSRSPSMASPPASPKRSARSLFCFGSNKPFPRALSRCRWIRDGCPGRCSPPS